MITVYSRKPHDSCCGLTPLGLRVHTTLIFMLAFTSGILIGIGFF